MIDIQKYVITEAFESLANMKSRKKLTESKIIERYSFPEVDNAIYHFRNDLGREPEVDDVIGFLEDEYPDWVPDDPDKYGKWYHDVAGEISARLTESKLTEAPEVTSVKDFAAKMRARKASQKNSVLAKINSQIDPSMSVTDQLQIYFDELVPESGPAETVAGELVRAMMRILYRDYNDGDLWYTGYGKETCGGSVVYIIEHINDLFRDFEKMSSYQLEDEEYTNALEDVAGKLMVYLNEHPELFITELDKDSRSGGNLDSYFDLPTYEFDVDASYDDDYYAVNNEDVDNFVRSIVEYDLSSGHVNRWASDAWTIEDLDKDDYDTLEENWERWFREFLEEYVRDDIEDDENYEEEEYEESLKEDTVKQGNKWVNKGDSGKTHGKFNTKKEADAQRRAMFANGYKG